jgi:hypothetical protein
MAPGPEGVEAMTEMTQMFNPNTKSIHIGKLRLATWGGKGYIIKTRGFAVSWNGRGRLVSVEIYYEGRKR